MACTFTNPVVSDSLDIGLTPAPALHTAPGYSVKEAFKNVDHRVSRCNTSLTCRHDNSATTPNRETLSDAECFESGLHPLWLPRVGSLFMYPLCPETQPVAGKVYLEKEVHDLVLVDILFRSNERNCSSFYESSSNTSFGSWKSSLHSKISTSSLTFRASLRYIPHEIPYNYLNSEEVP